MKSKDKAAELLSLAGVTINGPSPTDIQVKDERLYDRVFAGGSLALGEAYMDGWWEVEDMAGFFYKVMRAKLDEKVADIGSFWYLARSRFTNMQNKKRSVQVVDEHYDVQGDVYEAILDRWMQYTCGYWKDAKDIEQAQEAKLDLICKKLQLKPGMTLLDIGSGWGGLAQFAAERYGAHVTGITISQEQLVLAEKRCKGLPVTFVLKDYRDMEGQFDRVVSVGMLEHVGHKNYRIYLEKVSRLLKDDGLFLLHCIGARRTVYTSDPWFHKYIFPNGMLASVAQLGKAMNGLFIMEDWHNFGSDYDKTLLAWFEKFEKAWPQLRKNYNDRFYRMWKYYLLSVAGGFRARHTQLWQIVLSKKGVVGGYKAVR